LRSQEETVARVVAFDFRQIAFVTCGRICFNRQKINLSQVFAGQTVGVNRWQEGGEGIFAGRLPHLHESVVAAQARGAIRRRRDFQSLAPRRREKTTAERRGIELGLGVDQSSLSLRSSRTRFAATVSSVAAPREARKSEAW